MLKSRLIAINTILLCFFIFAAQAQGVSFETGNWTEALEKAKKEKRLIYLDIYAVWCGPCKMMDKNIFPTQEAGDKYNPSFINVKIDAEKGEGIDLAKKYNVTVYPTNLYIDPNSEKVVYKAVGATDVTGFLQRADFALAEFNDPMSIAVYQQQFKNGKRDAEFLKGYLEKAKRSDVYADDALNAYVELYTKTVNDSILDFLLINTMTFDNKAVDFLAKHKERINETHKGVNEEYFTEWKQQLPYHTFQKAVQNKDEKLIDVLYQNMTKYEFASNILGKRAFEIMYFATLDDTTTAIAKTTEMLNYLTKLPKKKYDDQNEYELGVIKKAIKQQIKKAGIPDSQEMAILNGTLEEHPEYAYLANFLAAQKLDEAAWNIYEEKKTSAKDLKNALNWSKKAVSLATGLPQWSGFASTYAHLLYLSGEKQKAITNQEEAIKNAKEKGVEGIKELEQVLEDMKSGTLK